MSNIADLNLVPELTQALEALNYTEATPIQAQAIPIVMEGHDLMGLAQTGTGKTAAFSLPILNHLCLNDREVPKKGARILVLAPTRELVTQISDKIRSYGRKMPHLSVATIFGGVAIVRHIKRLSGGADIIVATPGRLIDLLDRGAVTLKDVEMLVLDEADQMMDMGFIHALKKIVPLLPKERQTLLFSATMVPKIKKLAEQFLSDPKHVSVTPANSTADKVEQRVSFVNRNEKLGLLGLCLLKPEVTRAIVFTRTKHGADRVVKNLRQIGIDSQAIHGNKSQGQRQRALNAFRADEINVLVATDVAARGIDIPEVSHVFNYEIPNVPEQYVHRIGRTARANRAGVAHAFVAPDEKSYLKDIQKLLGKELPKIDLPDDFVNQSKALKKRPALPAPEKPKAEPRKGRGKGRPKPKTSDKKSGGKFKDRSGGKSGDKAAKSKYDPSKSEVGFGTDSEMTAKSPRKDKPSRAERKRHKAKAHQEKTGQGQKQDGKQGRKKAKFRSSQENGSENPRNSEKPRTFEKTDYAEKGGKSGNQGKAKFKRKPRKNTGKPSHASKPERDGAPNKGGKPDRKQGGKPARKQGDKPDRKQGGKYSGKPGSKPGGHKRGKPNSKKGGQYRPKN